MKKNNFKIVWLITIIITTYPKIASAYIDQGSGSMIIQIVVGGIVSFFLALKLYWKKLLRFLLRRKDE